MRKTKIICTIGPASENEEILTQMCLAGMNVARLNFSHGTHEEHEKKIELIKRVREKLGLPIAIMLDTKGPEYRIRTFRDGKIELHEGNPFTFTVDEVEGDETKVSVNYKQLNKDLQPGNIVTVNNGMVKFEVQEIAGSDIRCKCLVGGVLSNRKSMSSLGFSTAWTSSRRPLSPQNRMCWISRLFWMPTVAAILRSSPRSKAKRAWTMWRRSALPAAAL